MIEGVQKADATGKLELGKDISPVGYSVTVGEEKQSGKFVVRISVSAPRDWLLKRGFKSDVTLIKEDGHKVQLHHDGDLDVGDALSVELIALDASCSEESELQQRYPELRI